MPLFIRAGGIVLLGPVRQYADEPTEEPVAVTVYPGADGSFVWYEDAGDGYGYEQGGCARVTLTWRDDARTLSFSGRSGEFPGMRREQPFAVSLCGGSAVSVLYTGAELHLQLN